MLDLYTVMMIIFVCMLVFGIIYMIMQFRMSKDEEEPTSEGRQAEMLNELNKYSHIAVLQDPTFKYEDFDYLYIKGWMLIGGMHNSANELFFRKRK